MRPWTPVEPAQPVLDVQQLRTYFPTARGLVHAVDDVSFTVGAGETLGVVGESGSGKSVLARTVMALTPRDCTTSGTVTFQGRDLRALTKEAGRRIWGAEISMVFQDPATALNPVHRIGQQLKETIDLHLGLSKGSARDLSIELLHQVGIPEPQRRLRNYPHELSGGMRQRVCIAIAIACSPSLLFADEPTTALDVTIQRQILDLLSALKADNGMSMVLVSHDLGVVARRTDRLMVMYAGRVVEAGPTRAVFADVQHPYTAALLESIPRLKQRSHSRLTVLPGRPVDVVDPTPGCRFAPRCRFAQARCLVEDPVTSIATEGHTYSCFYPIGSAAASEALERNLSVGRTAAGLEVGERAEVSA